MFISVVFMLKHKSSQFNLMKKTPNIYKKSGGTKTFVVKCITPLVAVKSGSGRSAPLIVTLPTKQETYSVLFSRLIRYAL